MEPAGWNGQTRHSLERLLSRDAGKRLPVVFDFDNSIVGGDIGEATLAVLARSGILTPANVPAELCPPFRLPGREWMRMQECADVTEYYEALLKASGDGRRDPNPYANGYCWAVEVLTGLRPLDVIEATRTAYQWPSRQSRLAPAFSPREPAFIEVTPGKASYPVPFFYPEMLDLLAQLLRLEFDVWIVSASNVWSVRWMVLKALNPLLRERGLKNGLRGDHVIGISCLLTDPAGSLCKDSLLMRENKGYAALDEKVLARFHLTSRPHFPVPTYAGKVAAIFDAIGRNPLLAVGDSPGDHAMLSVSENKLWIAHLEKPRALRATRELIRNIGATGWMFQSTTIKQPAGFVPRPLVM